VARHGGRRLRRVRLRRCRLPTMTRGTTDSAVTGVGAMREAAASPVAAATVVVGVAVAVAVVVAAAAAAAARPGRMARVAGMGMPRRTAKATAAVPVGRPARQPRRLQRTRTTGRRRRLCSDHRLRSCYYLRPSADGV